MKLGESSLKLKGQFTIGCYNNQGELKWEETSSNQVTNVGVKSLLETYFAGSAQSIAWHVGLVRNLNALEVTDAMNFHPGWTEFTGYLNNRPLWLPAPVNGVCMVNSPPAEFAISSAANVSGFFLTNNAVKGGNSGLLWSISALNQTQSVNVGDSLRVVYQVEIVNV